MQKKIFMYEALRDAIDEEMARDKRVFVLGEDVGHYGGSYKVTKNLHIKYGDLRILDTPIAENSFTGMAIGAAMTGLKPIVEGMNLSFLLLAFNQISNNAGMLHYTSGGNWSIPLVVRGPGGIGKQLSAEHSQRIEAYFQAVPGLKIVACSTPYNAKGLLKAAIRDANPVLFLEHVLLYNLKQEIPEEEYMLPLDKAQIVREGSDVTIITYSRMRHHVMQAVEQLCKQGIHAEVIDLISLKPIDINTLIVSVQKTHKAIVVEECMQTGGIAAEVMAQLYSLAFDELDAPIIRLSSKDVPTPYNGLLEQASLVQPDQIVSAVKQLLKIHF
nr:pyruvate dehydrogenase E1 component beta subunit [Cyanidioschyzonaceae sp. 2]